MFNRYTVFWKFLFFILDIILLNLSIALSMQITMPDHEFVLFINGYGTYQLLFNLLWLLIVYWRNFYETELAFIPITRNSVSIVSFHAVLILTYYFLKKHVHFNREFILAFYLFLLLFTLFIRYATLVVYYYFGLFRDYDRKVLILGKTKLTRRLLENLSKKKSGYQVLGFYEEMEDAPQQQHDIQSFEYIDNLLDYAVKKEVNEVYVGFIPKFNGYIRLLMEKADKNFIRLKFIPDFSTVFVSNINVSLENELPIISIRREPLEDMKNRFQKKVFDIIFSFFVLVFILSWLIPIIGLIIKLTSKGPVFFKQNRFGIDGKPFAIYKFRTMKTVEKDAEFKQAQKNDPRITPIGKFLRKSSLDEVPQFINVLLGNMSVVGPRPHPIKLDEDYKDLIDNYMLRNFLKPGITGLAQVKGYRGETNDPILMQKRVENDIWYLENWSFLLDIKIVIRTVLNAIKGEKNAY